MPLAKPWLLMVGLAPLAVLIILYLLKMKRQELEISAVFLWRKSIDDMRANAPLQRLRTNLLFWLQVAVIVCLSLALAEPIGRMALVRGRTVVIVLDRSASMSTVEADGTRFDLAVRQARHLVNALSSSDRAAVISFGETASTDLAATTDRDEVLRVLRGLRPSTSGTRLKPALQIALSTAGASPRPEIHLFSDGAAADEGELASSDLGVKDAAWIHFHRVGRAEQNVGITSLALRPRPGADDRWQLFVAVRNFGPGVFLGELELYLGRGTQPVDLVAIDLPPGAEDSRIFELAVTGPVEARVRITPPDAFALDNQGFVAARKPTPQRVLLVTRANYFLDRATDALPDVVVTALSPAKLPKEAEDQQALFAQYSAVVLDRECPQNLPFGRYLMVDVTPPIPGWSAGEAADGRVIVDWNTAHPIMRFVNPSDLYLGRSRPIRAPEGAVVLIDTRDGPVGVAYADDRQRMVVLGFDLYQTNWPLLPSFPIFVANALRWLAGPSGGQVPMIARAGDTFALPAGQAAAGQVLLVAPDGRTVRLSAEPGRGQAVAPLDQLGFYTVEGVSAAAQAIGVNLLSPAESDIRPRASIDLGPQARIAASGSVQAPRRYWTYLVALAVGLLFIEWTIYVRRVRLEPSA